MALRRTPLRDFRQMVNGPCAAKACFALPDLSSDSFVVTMSGAFGVLGTARGADAGRKRDADRTDHADHEHPGTSAPEAALVGIQGNHRNRVSANGSARSA